MTENQIISLLKAKDQRAIEVLYDQYADNLYGVVRRIVNDDAYAEDVMQQSFFKVWQKGASYDPDKSKLFTWLLRIFRNTAIDKLRSLQTRGEKEIQTGQFNVHNYVGTNINPEALDLTKHVNGLDEKYIDVIGLIYFQGHTQKEASEKLNIPLGTVKTRLKDALNLLRVIYTKEAVLIFLISIFGI